MASPRSQRVEVAEPGLKAGLSDSKSMFFTTASYTWTQHNTKRSSLFMSFYFGNVFVATS